MRQQVKTYAVPVRSAAPQAVAIAVGLGWLHGKAIRGDNGATRIGQPDIGTAATNFCGYAFPPQLFTGWDPRHVAGGSVKPATPALSTSTQPATDSMSPMQAAMANVSAVPTGMRRGY
jgi:hypothetical protein